MSPTREPIAIIGTAGRFPGGCNSPSKLWDLLRDPRDVLREIPKERFNIDAFYHPDPTHHGTTNTRQSYFLDDDPAKFDAQFFNIPPAEAESIDPQQRMLMEIVYESLCSAGLPLEQLRGSSTAIYVGLMCDDWSTMIQKDIDTIPTYAGTGTARSIMANRISYFFDWHGPSMTIDTACSSSLVAVHQAVCALRNGESKVALAAGANLILNPSQYVAESNLRMLSPTGRSRMWDASADGYARGEGVAAVVLKTLSQAIADGDTIECIIRETGLNQDGRTSGLTVPSNIAQTNLIRETYARAGLDLSKASDRPQFFHAHGTGTKAGDPQEAQAIHNAFFTEDCPANPETMYVGSIKTIIGHTEGTAGLASLIGTALAIRNDTIPPNMHFNELNPDIVPYYGNLEVPLVARQWPVLTNCNIKRASINSFGFGGANAHAIIESYVPERKESHATPPSRDDPLFTPLVFSAASASSLRSLLVDYYHFLKENPTVPLRDLAWTLQHRHTTLGFRRAIAGRDLEQILAAIKAEVNGDMVDTRAANIEDPTILGIFTGQGAQWPRMGAELLQASPFVARRIAELDLSLATLPSADRPTWHLNEELLAHARSSRITEAALSQPLCVAVQIILVDLIEAAGIRFKAVVGHSSGEIAAAYAAGLISANDAVRIAYYRGLHAKIASPPGMQVRGAMAAVGLTHDEAEALCASNTLKGRVSVAAYNSPSSVTLSGDEDGIEEAIAIIKSQSKFARRLKVDTAYHSAHMKPCAEPYLQSLNRANIQVLQPSEGKPRWFSSVKEDIVMSPGTLYNQYWVDNMTQPVMFSSAIISAGDTLDSIDLAIEVGPHPALKGPAMDSLGEIGISPPYSGLLSRGKDDVVELSLALAHIWSTLGSQSVDFHKFDHTINADNASRTVLQGLPAYPFNHEQSYWAESRASSANKQLKFKPHPVLGMPSVTTTTAYEAQWRNVLSPKEIPWLEGHKLQGQIIFPATGYVAMAIEAMHFLAGDRGWAKIHIQDLTLERAIAFNDERATTETLFSVNIHESSEKTISASFSCYSVAHGDHAMMRNATGHVELQLGEAGPTTLPSVQPQKRFNMVDVNVGRFYSALTKIGYHYSEPFKGMVDIRRKHGMACGALADQSGSAWEDQLIVHPGMLDTALQTIFAAFSYPGDESLRSLHVPTHIDSITINPYFTPLGVGRHSKLPWEAVTRDGEKSHLTADVQVLSADAEHTFVQFEGVSLKPFAPTTAADDVTLFSHFEYLRDGPNGEQAAIDDRLSREELDVAKDMERIAFFYLRKVSEMDMEDKMNALPHHKHLAAWADYTVNRVRKGTHLSVGPECLSDTYEDILTLTDKYRDRVDALLIESTGQNLPDTIRAKDSILRHMTKDNLLGRFYEGGIGLSTANWWLARMAKQISHRYPHMAILEIGAGTGGTTQATLPSLGTSFSSYTYTDVSSGFFEAAEDKFREYADRMIFKVFDMVKSPAEQGFVEGSYDMILASNVLHVAEDLDTMMGNVRKLLKPGGFLVNLETVTNDMLRNGIIMGGLPGWWVGAESGRPHGPMLDLTSWHALLKRCGFDGIETTTPIYDSLHAVAVWAAQASDARVQVLKNPSSANLPVMEETLTIVGGGSLVTMPLLMSLQSGLNGRFNLVKHYPSVEALDVETLPRGTTVLSITDLDEPVMKSLTVAKLDGLKALWARAGNILWVTRGSRYKDPYANMIFGVGRVVRFENPNINLQLLDVDTADKATAEYIVNALLRHQILDNWRKADAVPNLTWSAEPELFLEDGITYIPRLYKNNNQNDRVNSARRKIFKEVNPATTALRLVQFQGAVGIAEVTALETMASGDQTIGAMRITQSLLQSVRIANVGNVFLSIRVYANNPSKSFMTLDGVAASPSALKLGCSLEIPSAPEFGKMALVSVAAQLVAQNVIQSLPKDSSIMIHEADKLLKATITSKAMATGLSVVFTTCKAENRGADCVLLPENLPTRLLRKIIPADVSLFADFSMQGTVSAEVGRNIAKLLPPCCSTTSRSNFFSNTPQLWPSASIAEAEAALKKAWEDASISSIPVDDAATIGLSDLSSHNALDEPLAVLNWDETAVPVQVHPVDHNDIFRSDRTYLLIGLSGEVGQSLCHWMVRHGARHVVLSSRNPVVDPEFIQLLEAAGADIRVMPIDITSRKSLERGLDNIKRTMPKLAGISNGALIVADSPFAEMDLDCMEKVLKPKVDGSIWLDQIFHDDPLDFFIMFSSLTACLGNSGQSNYAAANMFMTALAFQRRRRGVAGSVIDLSSLMGIGHVGRSETFDADYFKSLGATSVSETDLHQMFAEAIDVGRPDSVESAEIVTGMTPMSRSALEDTKIHYRLDLKFSHFCIQHHSAQSQGSATSKVAARVQLKAVRCRAEAIEVMLDSLLARVKKVLQISDDEVIDANESLVERGVDSLIALDIRSWFLRELDIDMPVLKILGGNSVADLVEDSLDRIPTAILDISRLSNDDDVLIARQVNSVNSATESAIRVDISTSDSSSPSVSFTGACTPAISDTVSEDFSALSFDRIPSWRESIIQSSTEVTAPMSFGQTRFWFLHHALEDKTTFNVSISVRLNGALNLDLFQQALQAVSEKHEAMRTRYFWSGDDMDLPTQGILSKPLIKLEHKAITDRSEAAAMLEKMRDYEWDLGDWESMRFILLSLTDDTHWFIFGCHHITIDGGGIQIIFSELEKAYMGHRLKFMPEESQYRSYAALQRTKLDLGQFNADVDFYRNAIPTDVQPIALLPFSKVASRQPQTSYRTYRADIRLDPETTSGIKHVARQNKSTNFHLYLAVLQALLFRLLPDTNEIFIGVADANRGDERFIDTLGFFLNILPIRFDRVPPKSKFSSAVKAARDKTYAALEHSALPFDVLLNELGVSRSSDSTPVFQVFIDYRQGTQERERFATFDAVGEAWYHPRTGYDISLDILENHEGDTLLTMQLQQSLYTQQQTELFLRAYVNFLKGLTKIPGRDFFLNSPSLWAEEDIAEGLRLGKGPIIPLSWPGTISHRIDQMIIERASEPALSIGDGTALTYAAMGQRVDLLSESLAKFGIGDGDIVGILQTPGTDWICSMLAVWRVGATYLPLDIRNSIHRIQAAVDTTNPVILLVDATTEVTANSIRALSCKVVDVSKLQGYARPKATLSRAESTAVILFTSGSTGNPKGVVLTHANLVGQSESFANQCGIGDGKPLKVLQQSPLSFDFSMEQIFMALCHGGCLYVVPAGKRGDPYEITRLILKNGINYTTGTPSEYNMWFKYAQQHLKSAHEWKYAFLGGEPFSDDFIHEFRSLELPCLRVFNNYGPCETTIAATYRGEILYNNPNLGHPLGVGFPAPNYSIYVVDSELNPLPLGVPGEILIAGIGVSRGYFGLKDATLERFLHNPFARDDPHLTSHGWTTVYRTGDLGRLRSDGMLCIDGRINGDTQVKISGFRVELTEIENIILLSANGALKYAVATARESDGTSFIAVHVVFSRQQIEAGRTAFLVGLQAKLPLPDYMRPAVMVAVEDLPLTPHSKIDRAAVKCLPLDSTVAANAPSMGPRRELSPIETKLVDLWNSTLPFRSHIITPETNFFHIGGSSLLLVKIHRMVKQTFGAAPSLVALMAAGRLMDMAAVIDEAMSNKIDWGTETAIPEFWKEKYSCSTGEVSCRKSAGGLRILLTGATGYLGRHLVPELVNSKDISQIFCIVRRETDVGALEALSNKVAIFPGDLGEANFGLAEKEYSHLESESDVILHCGANRSFWDDYEVLRPVNTNSVKTLVRLALPRRVPIHFLSSGSVRIYGAGEDARIYNADPKAVGECPPDDGSDGYVASKWAAEAFLTNVAAQFKLPVTLHTPMPVPGHGPDDSHAQPESDHLLNELIDITRRLQVRPTMEGLGGWADILPVNRVVHDIMASLLKEPSLDGNIVRIYHTGIARINWQRFIGALADIPELAALPSKDTLLWIGQAKRSGYSYFMPSHRLIVLGGGGDMISRR